MSTNASGPVEPSHTCTDGTFRHRQKLGELRGLVESAENMRVTDMDQDEPDAWDDGLRRAQQALQKFEEELKKSKKESCPACSVHSSLTLPQTSPESPLPSPPQSPVPSTPRSRPALSGLGQKRRPLPSANGSPE